MRKYERGTNRVGSSRLFELSKILDVPLQYFFDEMPKEIADTACARGPAGMVEIDLEPDQMAKRETLELVRAYYAIKSPRVRKRVYDLAKTLGASAAEA